MALSHSSAPGDGAQYSRPQTSEPRLATDFRDTWKILPRYLATSRYWHLLATHLPDTCHILISYLSDTCKITGQWSRYWFIISTYLSDTFHILVRYLLYTCQIHVKYLATTRYRYFQISVRILATPILAPIQILYPSFARYLG